MTSSLAVLGNRATSCSTFTAHITDSQQYFHCSTTKQEPLSKVPVSELSQFEFFQPSAAFCRFLLVDIDHIFALQYITDLPDELQPHAVVMTTKGVQAFWLIEGLPLTENAHSAPIEFARDVAELLRQACNGDSAVNALAPSKCRNPLYSGADVFFPADCPPYALKALAKPLRAFLAAQQPQEPTSSRPRLSETVWGDLVAGQRNETIFQTIRRSAYRGEDYEALAYELNNRCQPPLPLSEVAGIVRSVEKFMREKYTPKIGTQSGEPMPEQVREFLSEIGKKGRAVNSEAQQKQQQAFVAAGTTVRSAQAVGRKAQIQALKKAGYNNTQIAKQMGISRRTVIRALEV